MSSPTFTSINRPATPHRPLVLTQPHLKHFDHSHSVEFRDASHRPYKTFGDAQIESRMAGGPKGFGIDLDGDGQFNTRQDGYLTLDMGSQDTHQNITRTNDMLKAFSGDFDMNGDGTVSATERAQGQQYANRASQMDLDRDGVLSRYELQSAGAKVMKYKLGPTDAPVSEQVNLPGFERPQPPYQPPFGNPNMPPFFQSFMKNLFSMFQSFFSPQPQFPVAYGTQPSAIPFSNLPNAGQGFFG